MTSAFIFVTTRSFKNRIWTRLRRLREPRYLVSFIAGLAYGTIDDLKWNIAQGRGDVSLEEAFLRITTSDEKASA